MSWPPASPPRQRFGIWSRTTYGVLDWRRVYALAASDLGDLDAFCAALAERARGQA